MTRTSKPPGGFCREAVAVAVLLLALPCAADTVVLETPLPRGVVILDHDRFSGLGSSVAGIGDFDGDGIGDLAISAPGEDAVYILPGRRLFPESLRLPEEGAVHRIRGVEFSFRDHLFAAGDVDGDGLADLYIFDAAGLPAASRVILIYGTHDLRAEIDSSEIGSVVRGAILHVGGLRLAPLGDFNGDGIPDLALGQWTEVGPLNEHGAVTVVFGESDWQGDVDLADHVANGGGVVVLGSPSSDDVHGFGFELASAGDLNGDALADVIVADPRFETPQRVRIGRVLVLFGATDFPPVLRADDLGDRGITIENHDTDGSIGDITSVFGGGDLDGDGISEAGFAVFETGFASAIGRAYVIHGGHDLPRSLTFEDLEEERFGFVIRPEPGIDRINFGEKILLVPDEDGDGRDELLAGRGWDVLNDVVLRGSVPIPPESFELPLHEFVPPADGEVFIEDRIQAVVGDVNGDAVSDYVISFPKPEFLNSDPREPRVFLVFGGFETQELSIRRVVPAGAPVGASVEVKVTGSGFVDGMRVLFGEHSSDAVDVLDPHTLIARTPSVDAASTVDLAVVRPGGGRAELPGGFIFRGGQHLSVGELGDRITVFRVESKKFLPPFTLGDINGDGIEDYGFRRRTKGNNSPAGDSTYVVYGGTRWPPEVDEPGLAQKSVVFSHTGWPDSESPLLGALGDLNGDGNGDYYASFDAGGRREVAVILETFPPGSELTLAELIALPGVSVLSSSERIVDVVHNAADFDGDGEVDLLVDGRDMLIVRGPLAPGLHLDLEADESVVRITAEVQGVGFQAPIGDFNGDGRGDLAFHYARPPSPAGGTSRIMVIVLGHEPASGRLDISELLASGLAFELPYSVFKSAGVTFRRGGDLNRDGFDDVLVGILGSDAGVLFGREEPPVGSTWERETSGDGGFAVVRDAEFEDFGTDVALGGDLDGDGAPELAIGSPRFLELLGGAVPGIVYVVHGASRLEGISSIDEVERPLTVLEGFAPGDKFGWTVAILGDQDGDGLAELLVEAPFHVLASAGDSIGLACLIPGAALLAGPQRFIRGDANADGEVNISDALFILNHLFLGGPEPGCRKTADVRDSGGVDISDPTALLNFLFLSGPEPSPPYPDCGPDPASDTLSCASFPRCQ